MGAEKSAPMREFPHASPHLEAQPERNSHLNAYGFLPMPIGTGIAQGHRNSSAKRDLACRCAPGVKTNREGRAAKEKRSEGEQTDDRRPKE